MKKNLHTIVAVCIFSVLCICLIAGVSVGSISGFGWDTISALCPMGALSTMIASKTILPRGIVSLIIMALLVLLLGRAFCGWICPIPVGKRIKKFLTSHSKRIARMEAKHAVNQTIAQYEIAKAKGHECGACGACKQPRPKLDSRHAVAGTALLSTAVFGFPVFCLICPVGLTFAMFLLLYRVFTAAEATWALLIIPAMLIIEFVFLRKWCTRFCPLSALMNLVSRFSKTTLPEIDNEKCIETSTGTPCSKCADVCDFDINLRHPEYGELRVTDCSRCMECVDACPADAIKMPVINSKKRKEPFAVSARAQEKESG